MTEHRNLEYGPHSQITLEVNSDGSEYIKYIERCSKDKNHGIRNSRVDPKVTFIYPNKEKPDRAVSLYKCYVSHRPESFNKQGNVEGTLVMEHFIGHQ